jgi:hypothetical protein
MITYESQYFNSVIRPSEVKTKSGLTVSGGSFENNNLKKGPSNTSDTSEKTIDNRLNTKYAAIFPFWSRR